MKHPAAKPRGVHRAAALVLGGALALLAPAPTGAAVYGGSSDVNALIHLDDALLFTVYNPLTRHALWRTDGTLAGTWPLGLDTFGCIVGTLHPVAHAGESVFYAVQCDTDFELWVTDGTPAGTRQLTFLQPARRVSFSHRHQLWAPSLGLLFFEVFRTDDLGFELWVSDGTPEGTRAVADAAGQLVSLAALPGRVLFQFTEHSTPFGSLDLWTSDGTPAGTRRLGSLGDLSQHVGELAAAGPRAVWSVYDPETATLALYATRGEAVPPLPFYEIVDPQRRSAPIAPEGHGGLLYFTAQDAHGQELWRTDGTAAGTVRLTDSASTFPLATVLGGPPSFSDPGDGHLYFALEDPATGHEPWRTDGTADGTRLVADLCPGPCPSYPGPVVAHAGSLHFFGFDLDAERATVWRSDGTPAGTERLFERPLDFISAFGGRLDSTGDDLLLIAGLGDEPGQELWRVDADGTTTALTSFVFAAPFGPSLETTVAVVGGRLFFTADDGVHGNEPWVSDGTAAGTHLLLDLSPHGTASEPPSALVLRTHHFEDFVTLLWESPPMQVNRLIEVEARTPAHGWRRIAVLDGEVGGWSGRLPIGVPHTFRARTVNAAGVGPWSNEVSAIALPGLVAADGCTPGPATLCFADDRFSVSVVWRNQHGGGTSGTGRALADAAPGRSGYFWFFRPDNVELIVKILDGEAINGEHWLFYGALSDVEYWVTVVDHAEKRSRTYHNPPGEVCGRGDTRPFASSSRQRAGAASGRLAAAPPLAALAFDAAPSDRGAAPSPLHPPEPCVPDAATLCLADGRFRVRVAWTDHHNGGAGSGGALPFSERSGFFWFFRPDNVELVVKVLDGREITGKFWLFYGALTDVGYEIEVVDVADGHAVRRYVNPSGNLCGRADTEAF